MVFIEDKTDTFIKESPEEDKMFEAVITSEE